MQIFKQGLSRKRAEKDSQQEKRFQQLITIRRVWRYIHTYRARVLVALGMAVINVVTTLYVLKAIGDAVDCIVGPGAVDFVALIMVLKRIGFSIVIASAAQWTMNLLNNKVVYQVINDIRRDAFENIQHLPFSYIDGHAYGDVVSRMIADVDLLADGLLMGFTQFFTGILTIVVTLFFMFRESVIIAMVVVVLTPVSIFVARYIAGKTYHLFKTQSQIRGEQTGLIEEMVGSQKVVQAFGKEADAAAQFEAVNRRLETASVNAIFYSAITHPATRFVNGLVYAGVGIVGAISVVNGTLTVGILTGFLNYARQYTKPFNEISGVVTELQNAIACAARVFELVDAEREVPDAEDAIADRAPRGDVALDKVCFSYETGIPILKGISLRASAGQKIAVVGPTGCGKTTLINLLMRFYDADSGSISVDGIDIKQMTRAGLRSGYGMVLQDTWLKTGTVRENLCFGNPGATEAEMIEAAKRARVHKVILRMPNGYDTMVSDSGEGLSQGEKQLICIARVMLTKPKMLILDEATSSIDTHTELAIQEAFLELMEGRTSFIIAHRLSTIQNADEILVMNAGEIVERGRHDALLAQGGFYYKLYTSQFAGDFVM
jgi:ATP-binding cassette subfamily B protein